MNNITVLLSSEFSFSKLFIYLCFLHEHANEFTFLYIHTSTHTYMHIIEALGFYHRMIEEKRGVTVTDSGIPEVKSSSFPNGIQPQPSSKTSDTVAPAAKSSASWDEDWGPVSKGSAAAHRALASNSSPTPSISANQPVQSTFLQSPMTSAVSSKQTAVSCLPVDIEWPPPTSSTSSLNDIDPFADWPPGPSGTSSGSGSSNNGTTGPQPNSYSSNMIANIPNIMNLQNNGDISWAFNNQSSYDPLKPTQGASAVNSEPEYINFGFI
uniref:Uncharacterized protein n=1 Tax=Salix viminalis TaxID=40686 RepID=A0A6N2LFH7_SALVM